MPLRMLACALALAGCAQKPPAPPAPQRDLGPPPFVLQLAGSAIGPDLVLEAELQIHAPLGGPVRLYLELPAGSQLAAGRADEHIPADAPARVRRSFRVRGALAGPVRVIAEAEGQGWGGRAVRQWPPEPDKSAPRVRVGDRPVAPVRPAGER